MDVGMTLNIRNYPSRPEPMAEVYQRNVDDTVYGEQLGLDFVWLSEHHFAPDAWSPALLPILSYIAARTSRIELGTNLFLMPFHHPLRVAEDVATVDLLSGGRFTGFAVGSGSIEDEFQTFGVPSAERWGRLFESLHIVRESFARDVYDHSGKYFQFPNIRMTTKPVQRPFPLGVGGRGPKLLLRAGRERYHLQGARDGQAAYLQGLAEGGYDPQDFNMQVFQAGHVAATRDQAWDEAQEGIFHYRNFYTSRQWISGNARVVPSSPTDLRHEPNSPELVGTPDEILRRLEPELKGSRVTHFGLLHRMAGMPTQVSRRSLELYAREIMPVLRTWGREPVSGMGRSRSVA